MLPFFPDKVDRATLGNPVAIDADGLLMDVDVQAIDDNLPIMLNRPFHLTMFQLFIW